MNTDPDIWSPVDCDGMEPPPKPSIIAHIPIDLRSVDVLDGEGRRVGRLLTSAASKPISMDLTFEEEIPISGPLPKVPTGATMCPFTDTPGPKGDGARSGVQVEVPAEGWPPRWGPSFPGARRKYDGAHYYHLPDTEPGRIAAWVLEAK